MEYVGCTLRLLLISKFQVNNRITGDQILDAMKRKAIFKYQALVKCLMLMILCSCLDLEVQNLNAPDTERVLSDSDDIISVARGSFSLLHLCGWMEHDSLHYYYVMNTKEYEHQFWCGHFSNIFFWLR